MTGTVKLDPTEIEQGFEQYRRELTAYCYRMLGSAFEADDAVQETMVRAWRSRASFEGRSAGRAGVCRIAPNGVPGPPPGAPPPAPPRRPRPRRHRGVRPGTARRHVAPARAGPDGDRR